MEPHDRARDIHQQAIDFERLALSVLRAEAAAEGKTLLVGNELPKRLAFADGYAPGGILDLPGPCFIEVKLRYTDQVIDSIGRARAFIPDTLSYLIVLSDGRYPRERLPGLVSTRFPGVILRVINRAELSSLAERYPAAALPFTPGNLNRVFLSFRSSPATPGENEHHLTALRSAYSDDRLALFVGAGVSKSASYPDWAELVRRLAATMFDRHSGSPLTNDERREVQAFFEHEVPASPLIVARLLMNSLGEDFADEVRAALYDGSPDQPGSPLLRELGALCAPQRDRVGVQAVVNYNFDDLLEIELQRRAIAHRPIISEGEKALRSELPIFHVHGFLPRRGELTEVHRAALVLSEDAYHAQFVDPFIWTNLTQLNLLRNSVCLFIGVSMTDPNHRRLLEITAQKNSGVRHYAILRDHWTGAAARKLSKNAQDFARVFKGLEEASLASLGVSVIWVASYDDIPGVLSSIRQ